jgi:NitT/TauT family transport system permease protein
MAEHSVKKTVRKRIYTAISAVFWLLIWEIAARTIGSDILLVSPVKVLLIIAELVSEADFWRTLVFSVPRVILGFGAAVAAGIAFAVLSYINDLLNELISPLMTVIRATPVTSFIILALVWISSRNMSVLASFLMVVPVVYSNVYEGLRNTGNKLLEFAHVFGLSRYKKIRAIYIPAAMPYLASAAGAGLGLAFKAGIAAEVIGIPAGSIGGKLYEAKLYLMTGELLAWTVIIIIISMVFEKGMKLLMKRYK